MRARVPQCLVAAPERAASSFQYNFCTFGAWLPLTTSSAPERQVGEEVLGTAAKVEVSKESTTIVGDGTSEV